MRLDLSVVEVLPDLASYLFEFRTHGVLVDPRSVTRFDLFRPPCHHVQVRLNTCDRLLVEVFDEFGDMPIGLVRAAFQLFAVAADALQKLVMPAFPEREMRLIIIDVGELLLVRALFDVDRRGNALGDLFFARELFLHRCTAGGRAGQKNQHHEQSKTFSHSLFSPWTIFLKPVSSKMRIPSFFAFSSFDPASAPAITACVARLTLEATFPPRSSMRREASSRV